MIKWIKAKEGYIYELTEIGSADGRVRAKFENPSQYKQYSKTVPHSWIENKYVREVKA